MTPSSRREGDGGPAAAIAAAVLAVDGVVALSAGPAGQFRTYLPGGRSVAGVRLDDERVEIDVVVRYGAQLTGLGSAVAAAVGDLVDDGSVITVTVDDIVLPGEAEDVYLDDSESGVDADRADSHGAP